MIDCTTLQQLEAYARSVATRLKPGAIYGLEGELGAGKTTFVKQLAKALGIINDVISPTFIYHQTYLLPAPRGDVQRLHHYDLYRLSSDVDADQLGLDFDDPYAVHFVEWIEHAPKLERRAEQILKFSLAPNGQRMIDEVAP